MADRVVQFCCFCQSVACGHCSCDSDPMSTREGISADEMKNLRRQAELGGEFNTKLCKHKGEISDDESATGGITAPGILRSILSVVRCCCTGLSLDTKLQTEGIDIEEKMEMAEYGWVPNRAALLRKKNHLEINGDASTSRDGAKADPAGSTIVNIVPHLPIVPHPIDTKDIYPDVKVVAEDQAVESGYYAGEVVDHDVVTEEIAGLGGDGEGHGVDKLVVARETVNLGSANGDPIVLGVLSPADYTNLVFNVVLYLPLVDDYQ